MVGIRWWLNDKAPEFSADTPRPPKYTFEECFPDDKAIQVRPPSIIAHANTHGLPR